MKKIVVLLLIILFSCEDYGNPLVVEIEGCTNPYSPNYNDSANLDDGSCSYTFSYSNDIYLLLNNHGCLACHGNSGGLNLSTRESLIEGGHHGSPVILGDTEDNSLIINVLLGPLLDPYGTTEIHEMDSQGYGTIFKSDEIDILRTWIEEGAPE